MTKVFRDTFEDRIKTKNANIIKKAENIEDNTSLKCYYDSNGKFLGMELNNRLNEKHYWLT